MAARLAITGGATSAAADATAIASWVNARIAAIPQILESHIDPLRDLGFELEKKQFTNRHLAVTDPGAYKTSRDAQFLKMENAVKKAFDDSLKGFFDAGLPRHLAEQYALNAASNERAVQRQLMETLFPSGNNAVFAQSLSHHSTGNFGGMLNDPAPVATVEAPQPRAAVRSSVRVRAAPRRKSTRRK
jgi:hypothetical protein